MCRRGSPNICAKIKAKNVSARSCCLHSSSSLWIFKMFDSIEPSRSKANKQEFLCRRQAAALPNFPFFLGFCTRTFSDRLEALLLRFFKHSNTFRVFISSSMFIPIHWCVKNSTEGWMNCTCLVRIRRDFLGIRLFIVWLFVGHGKVINGRVWCPCWLARQWFYYSGCTFAVKWLHNYRL